MSKVFSFCAAAVVLAGTFASGHADAATQERNTYETGARACQGALPQFAGTLRARPLAIGNEGTANAFVTCGWEGTDPDYGRDLIDVYAVLGNTGSTPLEVSCSFVHGFGGFSGVAGFPTYVTRTVTVAPGTREFIELTSADLAGSPAPTLQWPQLSCSLPQGAVIHYIGSNYDEDIGAPEAPKTP